MATALDRLRELLRIPTVSYADESRVDTTAFDAFHVALERLYPLVHARLEREVVVGHALLFRWPGRASERPLVLMAHQDVLPVVEEDWERHPGAP